MNGWSASPTTIASAPSRSAADDPGLQRGALTVGPIGVRDDLQLGSVGECQVDRPGDDHDRPDRRRPSRCQRSARRSNGRRRWRSACVPVPRIVIRRRPPTTRRRSVRGVSGAGSASRAITAVCRLGWLGPAGEPRWPAVLTDRAVCDRSDCDEQMSDRVGCYGRMTITSVSQWQGWRPPWRTS